MKCTGWYPGIRLDLTPRASRAVGWVGDGRGGVAVGRKVGVAPVARGPAHRLAVDDPKLLVAAPAMVIHRLSVLVSGFRPMVSVSPVQR